MGDFLGISHSEILYIYIYIYSFNSGLQYYYICENGYEEQTWFCSTFSTVYFTIFMVTS